jgi:hypothetical protein
VHYDVLNDSDQETSMKALLTSAAVAVSLLTATVASAAAPVRSSAPMAGESELGGSVPLSVIIVLLTVLGGAIFLAVDDDDDDSPASA